MIDGDLIGCIDGIPVMKKKTRNDRASPRAIVRETGTEIVRRGHDDIAMRRTMSLVNVRQRSPIALSTPPTTVIACRTGLIAIGRERGRGSLLM